MSRDLEKETQRKVNVKIENTTKRKHNGNLIKVRWKKKKIIIKHSTKKAREGGRKKREIYRKNSKKE